MSLSGARTRKPQKDRPTTGADVDAVPVVSAPADDKLPSAGAQDL